MSDRKNSIDIWQQLGYVILLLVIVLGAWSDFSIWTILVRALIVWAAYSILVLLGTVTYNYWQLEQRKGLAAEVELAAGNGALPGDTAGAAGDAATTGEAADLNSAAATSEAEKE